MIKRSSGNISKSTTDMPFRWHQVYLPLRSPQTLPFAISKSWFVSRFNNWWSRGLVLLSQLTRRGTLLGWKMSKSFPSVLKWYRISCFYRSDYLDPRWWLYCLKLSNNLSRLSVLATSQHRGHKVMTPGLGMLHTYTHHLASQRNICPVSARIDKYGF